KGGAGFLGIDALVGVCHRAEDVFNVLRQGQRAVDARLMDAVLQVLDEVNDMFAMVQDGVEPESADQTLLDTREKLAKPQEETEPEPELEPEPVLEQPAAEEVPAAPSGSDDITEDEFEALLDELHGSGKHGGAPAKENAVAAKPSVKPETKSGSDDITEDEFDTLLDELHGKGKHGGIPQQNAPDAAVPKPEPVVKKSENITEDEFDALLDELHGKGKHTGVPKQEVEAT
ncbi:MAG: chemotaxis protein CheA, partial [Planctomycetes bacterium]|nr:chemotaxis protein CheA [Planctomycetota bacterium]